MNKKILLPWVFMFLLIPLIFASIGDGIDSTLVGMFSASSVEIAYIKVALFLTIFLLSFKSIEKVFVQSRGTALIIGLLLGFISARFIPEDIIMGLRDFYIYILTIIVILLPYFFGTVIADFLRWSKRGRNFLIIIFYSGCGYILTQWEEIGIDIELLGGVGEIFEWMTDNTVVTLIIVGLICLFILFRTGKSSSGYPSSYEPSRPGFFHGLGKGVGSAAVASGRLAGKGAVASGRWLGNKLEKVRRNMEIRRQRVMLKKGWAKARQKYLGLLEKRTTESGSQALRGSNIKKGTPGYQEYIFLRRRKARAERGLGKKPSMNLRKYTSKVSRFSLLSKLRIKFGGRIRK